MGNALSIQDSLNHLDQLDALHRAAARALSYAIEAASHYTVEINAHDAGALRMHLDLLAAQAAQAESTEEYESIRSSFRGELRDYRDKAYEELGRLRNELAGAVKAMQAFAEGISAEGDEYKAQLHHDLDGFRAVLKSEDIAEIRRAAVQTIESAARHCDDMYRSTQMVVTQLRDEIRNLHQVVEKERQAAFIDRTSGVWNRAKLNARIEDLVRLDDPFCLLFVGIHNLRDLQAQYSRTMLEESIKSLLRRFMNIVSEEAMVGRWTEEVFVAILDLPPSVAQKVARQAESKLAGSYSFQENGLSRTLRMDTRVALVHREKGASPAIFYPAMGQAASSVGL